MIVQHTSLIHNTDIKYSNMTSSGDINLRCSTFPTSGEGKKCGEGRNDVESFIDSNKNSVKKDGKKGIDGDTIKGKGHGEEPTNEKEIVEDEGWDMVMVKTNDSWHLV